MLARSGMAVSETAIAEKGARGRATASAVALADVTIAFRMADSAYVAVERAALSVADGEFVAIVGPTGCGKSTLLNVAAGLLAPSAGTMSVFGTPLAGLNRQAGYLFQADALFPWKTALENVAIGLETAGVAGRDARERAAARRGDPRGAGAPGSARYAARARSRSPSDCPPRPPWRPHAAYRRGRGTGPS